MTKITSNVTGVPSIEPRQEPSQGDLLVAEDGSVFVYSEYDKVVCIAPSPRNRGHYVGEEFDGEDPYELEENIGSYMINPKGLVVTLTVQ